MDHIDILGTPIPDAGLVFFAALAIHITAGITCVICGASAALTGKGSPRHRRSGRVYLWSWVVVYGTLTVMSAIRWRENVPLFIVGTLGFAAALTGHANRRHRPGIHILAMGASYVLLLTGFYVDNGPRLPLWDKLPTVAYWLLPALIGAPLTARAIVRRRQRRAVNPEARRSVPAVAHADRSSRRGKQYRTYRQLPHGCRPCSLMPNPPRSGFVRCFPQT